MDKEIQAYGDKIYVRLIKDENKGLIQYEERTDYNKVTVISKGDKIEGIEKDDILYISNDCVKVKVEEDTMFITEKAILGKL